MPRKATLSLPSSDRLRLQNIVDRGENWRERQRARTLILLNDGLPMIEVAEAIGINIRTVGLTRIDWLARGFLSLSDAPRSGAPRKLSPRQLEKIQEAAKLEPLTAKALLAKHVDDGGTPVHLNTLTAALKRLGFVWKRTRHSLKKKGMKTPSELPK